MSGRIAVVGLDLSLSGLGIACAPSDWDLEFGCVRTKLLETKPGGELVDRISALAFDVAKWLEWAKADMGAAELHVWIEGGIMMRERAHSIRSQIKLAGVVEHVLRERKGLRVVARTAEQNSARKLFLGRLTRPGELKDTVIREVRSLAGAPWDNNVCDAFVVLQHGLHELGAPCFTGRLPPKVEKPKTSRKRRGIANGQAVVGMVQP